MLLKAEAIARKKFKDKGIKNICLEDLLPVDRQLDYFAIITSLFIKKNKFESFSALFESTGLDRSESNLSILRNKYQLIEGNKILGAILLDVIKRISSGSQYVYISCYDFDEKKYFYWKVPINELLHYNIDLLRCLPIPYGEYRMCDENCNWFWFLRDDDPFIYMAAEKSKVNQLKSCCEDYIMELSRSFIFTWTG